MKILFVNTHFFAPQSMGGMAITLDQLASGLAGRGHQVSVVAGFRRGGWFGWLTLARMRWNALRGGAKVARDRVNGYPVWRSWNPIAAIPAVIERERPEVIVIMGGQVVPAATKARASGLPVLVQVHDVELHWHGGDFAGIADLPCIANSQFTAADYRTRFGNDPQVIYPFIDARRYRVEARGGHVTFVNPYLRKGLLIALRIAASCPEIPFLFVGHIHEQAENGDDLAATVRSLPNVKMVPPQGDMRQVYAETRVLLAPSQWQEAYGRVATEAQVSGIPVVGSDRGGLSEAIGPGGIVVPHDADIGEWTAALRMLWNDAAQYQRLSAAALSWATRPELDPAIQLDAHELVIRGMIDPA